MQQGIRYICEGCEEIGTFSKLQEFKTETEVDQFTGRAESGPLLRYSEALSSSRPQRALHCVSSIRGDLCLHPSKGRETAS